MPHNWTRPRHAERKPATDPALDAANRLMHNDYPQDWTLERRQEAFIHDAELVAGAYMLHAVTPTTTRRGYMRLLGALRKRGETT